MFVMPENLAELGAAELDALRTQAEDAFTALYDQATADGATPTTEQLADLEALSGHIQAIDTQATEATDAEARAAAAAELRAKVQKPAAADDSDDDTGNGDDTTDGADADDTTNGADAQAAAEEVKHQEDAMAAAGRRRTSFAGLPADDKGIPEPKVRGYQMNPHVAGYVAGDVTSRELALAYDRMRHGSSFGNRQGGMGGTSALGLGSLPREFPEELVATDEASLTAALDLATNERNLTGQSLTAAGGWCAPSETLYGFLDIPAASELLSLPEVNINRGGVRFPTQPDFGAVFADPDAFFHYTEAEAIAQEDDKPCFEIPCGEFEEVRLDAIGMCITAGILQQKGYPEIVQLYINGLLKNHQHRLSQMGVAAIQDGSTAVTIPASAQTYGAFGALLNSIEMAIVDMRLNQRIPDGTTLEVILPVWAKPLLRADLTHRRSQDGSSVVTDQQLQAHFTARGAAVQYVGEYQSGGTAPGGTTPLTAWPDTIEFLVYPAGTWFRALQNVIEVGMLYDQAQLKQNRYTALFTEDAYAVIKRGTISRAYTVPVSPSGIVGPAYTAPAAVEPEEPVDPDDPEEPEEP